MTGIFIFGGVRAINSGPPCSCHKAKAKIGLGGGGGPAVPFGKYGVGTGLEHLTGKTETALKPPHFSTGAVLEALPNPDGRTTESRGKEA